MEPHQWILIGCIAFLLVYYMHLEAERKAAVQLHEMQIQGTMCKNMYKQNLISAGEYATIEVGWKNAQTNGKGDAVQRTLIDMYWKNAYKFTKKKENLRVVVPDVKQVVQKIRDDPSYDLTGDYFRMLRKVYGMKNIQKILTTNKAYEKAWVKWEARIQ